MTTRLSETLSAENSVLACSWLLAEPAQACGTNGSTADHSLPLKFSLPSMEHLDLIRQDSKTACSFSLSFPQRHSVTSNGPGAWARWSSAGPLIRSASANPGILPVPYDCTCCSRCRREVVNLCSYLCACVVGYTGVNGTSALASVGGSDSGAHSSGLFDYCRPCGRADEYFRQERNDHAL